MKANILHQPAKLYAQPNAVSPLLAEIPVGEAVDIGSGGPPGWTPALRGNGQRGFLPGDTAVVGLQRASLLQQPMDVRAEPDAAAAVLARVATGETFWLWDNIQTDSGAWVRVRTQGGVQGYAPGSVKIKVQPQPDRRTAGKSMLIGLAWCAGGIVVSVVTFAMAQGGGGGTYLIAWGPAIFGGFQFLRGAAQFMSAAV